MLEKKEEEEEEERRKMSYKANNKGFNFTRVEIGRGNKKSSPLLISDMGFTRRKEAVVLYYAIYDVVHNLL